MVMIRRKTKKGSVGKTRPALDYKAIGKGKNKPKKKTTTTVKSNRPTDGKTKTLRSLLKNKQKIANEIGTKGTRPNQAFLGGSASQIPKSKPKKTKRLVDKKNRGLSTKARGILKDGFAIGDQYGKAFGLKKGGKAKMMKGGKTTKYMAKGGKTTKYMARGGKTSKYMSKGGRAK